MAQQGLMFVAAIIVAGICGLVQAQQLLGGGEAFTALRFNGGAFVRVSPAASIAATEEFSFEAWIKVPVGDTGNDVGALRPIVSRFLKTSTTNASNDFFLGLEPRGKVVFFAGSDSDELGFILRSNIALQDDTWYHVAVSIKYSDINNPFPYQANLYVDNYSSGLTRDSVQAYWYGPGLTRTALLSEPFSIGKYATATQDHYFKGTIDEVRIWQGKRSGDDINNFAFRTVREPTKDTWALTPEQGGTSSNKLVLSYNFNAAPYIIDQSGNDHEGTIVIDNTNESPTPYEFVPNDNKPIITFVYATGSVPEAIQLLGLDFNDVDAIGLNFEISFDGLLNGRLFQRHLKNGEGVNPFPAPATNFEVTPGIGAAISSGSVVANNRLVFIHDPDNVNKNGKFHYRVTNGAGDFSLEVEVRIIVSCLASGDQIDVCGNCNGNGAALDVCGVCNGDGTQCVGCDGVVNSGLVYDACGVCNGNGLSCIGCDGVINSGLVYDDCGVCGGANDTCWGCDGAVGQYDICGVCNGFNDTCDGCDGVAASGKVYDLCGVCDGDSSSCWGCDHVPNSGLTYDICGECGGFNDSCRGCDGVPNSGIILDNCGVCAGNGSTCAGCDGSGGGVVDACGVCRGDNTTCGGCDGKGGVVDTCGVCAGDNSTCTCVAYHGYHIQELDYVLLQWGLTHSISDIDKALKFLDDSLGLLTNYRGDLDLASVVLYLQDFLSNTAQYEKTVLDFKRELDISLGNIYVPI